MRAELPRYTAYRPTESEWLGELPEGWQAIQLARINTKLTNGFVGPTRDILRDEGVRYLQSLHIKGGQILFDTPYFVSPEWSAAHRKAILKTGDVLIVQTGDIGQVAAVTDEFADCSCHALIIVRAKRQMIDGFFLSAVLRSHYGFHSLKSVQTGALHPHLNCTNIRDIFLPIPPLPDQRAILAFLDRETAKIDRLIAVRREQVECLQEQRTAVIHHAVTKGLDPQAKMKPSGVEWLDAIPDGWNAIRMKYFARLRSGEGITAQEFDDEGAYPVYGGNGLRGYANAFTHSGKFVLIGRQGALCGNIHMVAGRFWASEHAVVATLRSDFSISWFAATLLTMNLNQYSVSAAQPGLAVERIQNLHVPVPPATEQIEIAAHIDRETAKIDALIAKYQRELELLAEYRASLISHAVTGKIDVRGLVEPQSLEAA